MKKALLAIVVAVVMSVSIAGCSATSNSSSASGSGSEASSSVQEENAAQANANSDKDESTGAFSMVGIEKIPLNQGFYKVAFTLKNNTSEELELAGFNVIELDSDGNIINSYMSFGKNATKVPVEPGQQASIQLTFNESDNIAGFKSTKYFIQTDEGKKEGSFTEPFVAML